MELDRIMTTGEEPRMEAEEQGTGRETGGGAVLVAEGHVVGEAARELVAGLEQVAPGPAETVTVDLRGALSLEPVVVPALLLAAARRPRPGGVRVLVTPGPVQRFLDLLDLEPVVELVHPGEDEEEPLRVLPAEEWRAAREGAIRHYEQLLASARRHDREAFAAAAAAAHPICVASGAEPGGRAFGEWCDRCPLRAEYGGCQPLLEQATRAAEHGNWDAAQLLVMALIAEVAGMRTGAPEEEER
jgi:hypothetical protein